MSRERNPHQSIVVSHEESRKWHDEAIRVLAKAAQPWPSCCGTCKQGRALCVTPQACQRAEPSSNRRELFWLAIGLACLIGVVLVAAQ